MTGLRILIAEDVHTWRAVKLEDLRRSRYRRGDYRKGAALRPDSLLLNVTMPDMKAAEVIPRVIQFCPTIKIVALAVEGAAKSAANTLAASADGLALNQREDRECASLQHYAKTQIAELQRSDSVCNSTLNCRNPA